MGNSVSAQTADGKKSIVSSLPWDALIAFLITAGALIFYWPMVYPGNIGTADSMKYHFIGSVLGLSHPPGSPLYILLNWLVSLIPIGELAWRINLFSAVCAAASGSVLYLIVVRLSRSRIGGVVSAALFLTASIPWSQALIAEVYTLWVLLALLSIYYLITFGQTGSHLKFFLAWLFLGLSFAVHLSSVFLLPGFLFYLLRERALILRSFRGVLSIATGTLIGFLPYLYYPLRFSLNPAYSEYRRDGLGGFFSFITGGQYHQRYFAFTLDQFLGERFDWLTWILTKNFSFILWIFVVIGCVLLVRHVRRTGVLLSTMIVLNLIFVLGYDVGDAYVFLIPTIIGGAIATGYLVAQLARAVGKSGADRFLKLLPPVCAFLFLLGTTRVIEQETIIAGSILCALFFWLAMYTIPRRFPKVSKWTELFVFIFALLLAFLRVEALMLFAAFYLGTVSVQMLLGKNISFVSPARDFKFIHAFILLLGVMLLNNSNIQETQRSVDYRRYLPKERYYRKTLANLEENMLFMTSDQRNLFGPLYLYFNENVKADKKLNFGSHKTYCERLRSIPFESWDFQKLNLAIYSDLQHCIDDQRILTFRTDVNPTLAEFLTDIYDDTIVVLTAPANSINRLPRTERNELAAIGITLPDGRSTSFCSVMLKKNGLFSGLSISEPMISNETIAPGEAFESNGGERMKVDISLEGATTFTEVSFGNEVIRTFSKLNEIQLVCFSRPTASFIDRFVINTSKGVTLQRDFLTEVPYFQPYIRQQRDDKMVSFARQMKRTKALNFGLAAAQDKPFYLTVFIRAAKSPTIHLNERAFIEGGYGTLLKTVSFQPKRITMEDLVDGNRLFSDRRPFAVQFVETDIDRIIELSLDGRFKDFEMLLSREPVFSNPGRYEVPEDPSGNSFLQ